MLTEANPPTVFVVSDDGTTRALILSSALATGRAVRYFSSAGEFRAAYEAIMPGCLVLDVASPLASALEFYEQLVREGKRLPAIFLLARSDALPCAAGIRSGAIEFLDRHCDSRALSERVEAALALDDRWRQREAEDLAICRRIARLSDREQDTLDLILSGASDKALASKLYVSPRAVEMRRQAIMRKLQVRSLGELLDVAVTQRVLAEISSALSETWLRG